MLTKYNYFREPSNVNVYRLAAEINKNQNACITHGFTETSYKTFCVPTKAKFVLMFRMFNVKLID